MRWFLQRDETALFSNLSDAVLRLARFIHQSLRRSSCLKVDAPRTGPLCPLSLVTFLQMHG